MGLRHSLGILAETRVDFDITNSIEEALQSAAVNRRRVHSHSVIAAEGLRFLGERGEEAAAVTRAAAIAKAKEGAERSAPVYFGGADNQDPAADQIVDPPPCGYALTAGQYGEVAGTLALLGANPRVEADGSATVLMAQAAEPLIPLLPRQRLPASHARGRWFETSRAHRTESAGLPNVCPDLQGQTGARGRGGRQAPVRSHRARIGRSGCRLLVIAAAILAAAISPTAAQAAETGVVPDLTWGVSRKTQDRTATALRGVGAQWVRMSISWSDWVEPSDDSYNSSALSSLDRAVDLARGAGYRIIVMVEESPSWARDGTNKSSPPRDNAELAEFMAFLANRYVGKVQAYEVWNEPNLPAAWPTGPDPAEYARMLRAVAPSIRAADPTAKILFGGLSRNDYEYLEGAYAAMPDIGDYFDVMATHPYVHYGQSPEAVWHDGDGRISKGAFSAYREVRATMAAHGDTKPIWFTEFGWSTTTQSVLHDQGVSPQTQADYLVRAYDCLSQDPYVEVATWYGLRNDYWLDDADTWVAQLGLLTTDFTRKPAYYALKNYVQGAGGCSYANPVPPADPAPAPEPAPEPAPAPAPSYETQPSDEGDETVISSTVRSPAMLNVTRAQIRHGSLAISGSVARGATGRLRGRAHFGRGLRRFTAPIDSSGAFRIHKRLRGARRASSARITLTYRGNRRLEGESLTLRIARRSAQLRVLKQVARPAQ